MKLSQNFLKPKQYQFDEIKRQLIDSLPLLYSLNYSKIEKGNIDEFCTEIIEKRIKYLENEVLTQRASRRGGTRKKSKKEKLSFRKKVSK